MGQYPFKRWFGYFCSFLVILLSGCASYVTTQVTAFSDWKPSAYPTFAFATAKNPSSSQGNLEQTTYQNMVAHTLEKLAFQRVDAAKAQYLVYLRYGIKSHIQTTSDPIYNGFWAPPFGCPTPFSYGWDAPLVYQNRTFEYYEHRLQVRIVDKKSNREVYRVMAENLNSESSLLRAMPFLVDSAFYNFPLNNGQVIRVRLPAH